ncbi:MAG TPA: hypothetical protein VNZ94_01940 [Xanthobacteraceae bacterium]|nr:hypothetical protein [Xanthobacteraceae bacterium]
MNSITFRAFENRWHFIRITPTFKKKQRPAEGRKDRKERRKQTPIRNDPRHRQGAGQKSACAACIGESQDCKKCPILLGNLVSVDHGAENARCSSVSRIAAFRRPR